MKKRWLCAFIALFFLVCSVPLTAMCLAGPAPAAANEIAAPKPKLIRRGTLNTAFLSELSAYASRGFRPRLWCITAWDAVCARLFGASENDDVVLGRDGWLFYFTAADDRAGAGLLPEAEIWRCARNVYLMQEYAESQGARFLFVMPNAKYDLYPQYTRDYVRVAEGRNVDALQARLAEMGVAYCDMYALFSAQDEVLYWHTDSHWNGRGAALAADGILTSLGRGGGWFDGEFTAAPEHRGDLYEMLYPAGTYREPDYAPAAGFTFTYESRFTSVNDMEIETRCADGEGTLLMYRDSFGRSLYPYLAERFETAAFSRENSYDLVRIGALGATDAVVELGQRNVRYLIEYTAVFPAPERPAAALDGAAALPGPLRTQEAPEALPGYVLVSGGTDGTAAPVYIRAGGRVYEASHTADGFAAYLPAEDAGDAVAFLGA